MIVEFLRKLAASSTETAAIGSPLAEPVSVLSLACGWIDVWLRGWLLSLLAGTLLRRARFVGFLHREFLFVAVEQAGVLVLIVPIRPA
jgi:hypothetical protein